MGIATPFSSIARRIASRLKGTAPRCQAWPSMNMLVAMASPINAVAMRSASTTAVMSDPAASSIALMMRRVGKEKSTLRVNWPSSFSCALTTTCVRPLSMAASTFWPEAVTMSQPSTRSAPPAATRMEAMSCGLGAMRRWLVTAPPFWARPAMSMMPVPSPSRCAAMPSTAPIVTTPVPPTPVMMMP